MKSSNFKFFSLNTIKIEGRYMIFVLFYDEMCPRYEYDVTNYLASINGVQIIRINI